MDRKSILYQPTGMRMNSIMNGFTERDEDYQALPVLERRRRPMDSYNLSYSLGFEQLKRLSNLARRCRGNNG